MAARHADAAGGPADFHARAGTASSDRGTELRSKASEITSTGAAQGDGGARSSLDKSRHPALTITSTDI
jgi:hypothetical protein